MKMFVFLDVPEIEARIAHLEDIISNGAQQSGDPSTGSATFLTLNQNRQVLAQLYDRWEEKTGRRVQERKALTVVNVQARRH